MTSLTTIRFAEEMVAAEDRAAYQARVDAHVARLNRAAGSGGGDGLCDCDSGTVCPRGKIGSEPRCTLAEKARADEDNLARIAYATWAQSFMIKETWDELATGRQWAWRNVIDVVAGHIKKGN